MVLEGMRFFGAFRLTDETSVRLFAVYVTLVGINIIDEPAHLPAIQTWDIAGLFVH
jgi:hypothetical protein